MHLSVRDGRRLASGLLFLAIGALGMIYGSRYRMGSATHMGPGYFPVAVSAVIAALGLIAAATSFGRTAPRATAPVQWHFIPLVFLLAGVVAFGALVEHAGLAFAIAAVVVLGCYQRLLTRPVEVLAIGAVLTVISVALFIHGLGMPWHAFPQ